MTKFIPLTQGYSTIIDDCDYEKVSKHSWCAHLNPHDIYAQANINQKRVFLHRFIMEAPKNSTVDHVDGNSLDNRRHNLRIVDKSINSHNWKTERKSMSGIRNVYECKSKYGEKVYIGWTGEITIKNVRHRKYFANKNDAIKFVEGKKREYGIENWAKIRK